MRESVLRTSAAFWLRVGVLNIEAKASSVTFRGRPRVTEIGRWREKKEERARTVKRGSSVIVQYVVQGDNITHTVTRYVRRSRHAWVLQFVGGIFGLAFPLLA